MQYFVMQKAREAGVVVMLDGQGGDELLLGYERYYVSWLYAQKGIKKLRNFFQASQNSKLDPLTLFQYYFYFTQFKLRFSRIKSRFRFIRPGILKEFDPSLLREHVHDFRNFDSLQRNEIFKYQLPHLLKYEDRNSMANSIEARLPFLDYRVVELALSLPVSLKIRAGFTKYILRKSMVNNLPEEILWRKNKFGFNAPVQSWMSDRKAIFESIRNSSILSEIIGSTIPEAVDLNILWRLYNIALWEQAYDVKLEN
jgi:asparagine synthase (glutamine-hydrolysing)